MSMKNGVWHDAKMDPPKTRGTVLAIKQLKDGRREYCLAYCIRDYEWTNPATGVWIREDRWVCQGNNHIIYWMPLPEIQQSGDVLRQKVERDQLQTDFNDCVNELCLKCGQYHREHEGACDGCRWLTPRRGW